MRVRIVTDSPSDVPPHLLEKYQIEVIPVYINFGAESYLDNESSLPRAEFYRRLKIGHPMPTTAASSEGDAERLMRDILKDADHVVAVHIAPSISSEFNSSRLAAEAIGNDKVFVFDSGSLSLGSGWLAIIAAEKAAEGADPQTILSTLKSAKERLRVWAFVDSLEYLRRSGRVNWLRASVGALLDIKPIILLSGGEVKQVGRVRTAKNAFNVLVDNCRQWSPLERLGVLHTAYPQGGEALRDALADIAPPDQTLLVDVSAAIGTHLGPRALGIAAIRKS